LAYCHSARSIRQLSPLSLLYVTNYGVSVFNEADTNSQLVTAAKPGPFCK